MEFYYIATQEKKKKVLATKDIQEVYEFIVKWKEVKLKKLDYTGKTKSYSKIDFMNDFYKLKDSKHKLFDIVPLLLKGRSNVYIFLTASGMYDEYKAYKEATANTI